MKKSYYSLGIAFVVTAFIAYGSLLPFTVKPISFQQGFSAFWPEFYQIPKWFSKTDFASNILLFIPLSFVWMLFLEGSLGIAGFISLIVVFLFCTIFSFSLEFSQVFIEDRFPGRLDFFANLIGALVGQVLWLNLRGSALLYFERFARKKKRPRSRVFTFLQFYFVGFFLYSMFPFDISLRIGELYDKYQEGRLVLIPFYDLYFKTDGVFEFIFDILVYVPVGLFFYVRAKQKKPDEEVDLHSVFDRGIFTAITIELMQIIILTRFASVTDLISANIGIYLSLFVGRAMHSSLEE